MRRLIRFLLRSTVLIGLFLVAAGLGSLGYFHYAPPKQTCLSCHEMQTSFDRWASSPHGGVHCRDCHGGSLTLDVHALEEHANRVVGHFRKDQPARSMRLTERQVLTVSERCAACHREAAAGWAASGHAASYQKIFLDERQNKSEQLAGDCLRCHGMFFDKPIDQLVKPLSTQGPWQLIDAGMASKPAMPCLACHQVHHEPAPASAKTGRPATRAGLYSRREKVHFTADLLPVPAMKRGDKALRVSADPRQRVCVQCHAPSAFHLAGSSDDRTPAGVHEGLSCVACHNPHSNDARASCVTCHPGLSHCGLDVEQMDTTSKAPASKHNIHTVACGDCHNGQRPAAKVAQR